MKSSMRMSLSNAIYFSMVFIERQTAHQTIRDPAMTSPIYTRGYPSSTRYGDLYALSAKRNPEMTATKKAYGKNPVPRSSFVRVMRDFFSCFSIRTCTGERENATISPTISRTHPAMSGAWISIVVRNGRATINTTERRETFPEIREETLLYSSHRPSFSSVPFRNDDVVPLANALSPTAIQMLPRRNTRKPSAER